MSLERLSVRERMLAMMVGAIMGGWLIMAWVVQPLWVRVSGAREEFASRRQKLDTVQQLLHRRQSVDAKFQQASVYMQSAPDPDAAQQMLLQDLEALARQSGVPINLKPRPGRREGQLMRLGVEAEVHGSQEQLLSFLDGLLQLPRLVVVERLRLGAPQATTQQLRASLLLELLVVSP